MATYLVTGGAGFIGSHIVSALLARGDKVRVIDDFSSGQKENLTPLSGDLDILNGDIRDPSALKTAVAGCQGVFHLAARPSVVRSVEDPHTCWDVNLMGTVNVIAAALSVKAKMVFAGSSSAYGEDPELPKVEEQAVQPLSPYAAAKVAGEHAIQCSCLVHGLDAVILRFFNVFGPRQVPDSPYSGVIAKFTGMLLAGEEPVIDGDGSQSRDFTYVDNVVAGNLLAMERAVTPGTVINLACGDRISVNDLFHTLNRILGGTGKPQYGPPRAGDVPHSQADITRATELLGYKSIVSFADGMKKTVAWYQEHLS